MARPVHLRKAPITEALLDVQVRLAGSPSYESLLAFAEVIASDYPQKTVRQEFKAQIAIGDGPESPVVQAGDRVSTGYMLRSADGTQVVQARINGFSFSRLRPYTTWEDVSGEARRLWALYASIAQPVAITRIGLRYINRITIPLPFSTFGEYIRTVPEIAPGLPQGLQHFFMHLAVPIPDQPIVVLINQTIDQQGQALGSVPLIFDIDAFQTEGYDPSGNDLWSAFDVLRTLKNDFFFRSITQKTVELCQ